MPEPTQGKHTGAAQCAAEQRAGHQAGRSAAAGERRRRCPPSFLTATFPAPSPSGDQPVCRICLETAQPGKHGGKLIQPCRCAGTMAWIHEHCLAEAERHSHTPGCCGACRARYNTPTHIRRRRLRRLAALAAAATACTAVAAGVAAAREQQRQALERARLQRRRHMQTVGYSAAAGAAWVLARETLAALGLLRRVPRL